MLLNRGPSGRVQSEDRQGTGREPVNWVADLHETGRKGHYFISVNRYIFVARKPM